MKVVVVGCGGRSRFTGLPQRVHRSRRSRRRQRRCSPLPIGQARNARPLATSGEQSGSRVEANNRAAARKRRCHAPRQRDWSHREWPAAPLPHEARPTGPEPRELKDKDGDRAQLTRQSLLPDRTNAETHRPRALPGRQRSIHLPAPSRTRRRRVPPAAACRANWTRSRRPIFPSNTMIVLPLHRITGRSDVDAGGPAGVAVPSPPRLALRPHALLSFVAEDTLWPPLCPAPDDDDYDDSDLSLNKESDQLVPSAHGLRRATQIGSLGFLFSATDPSLDPRQQASEEE
ncbi:hypothetical protein CDD83_5370 [Cordyceps sp. RAO-2017]|nr:hypothetical protein CDD83_5370 [Cordyceps sp. RAO-2017]